MDSTRSCDEEAGQVKCSAMRHPREGEDESVDSSDGKEERIGF